MEFETILYTERDGIAVISLNRPEVLNAQNRQLVKDFLSALRFTERQEDVKVVIIKGEGRAFCSGDDLSETHDLTSPEQGIMLIDELQDTTRVLLRLPKPVIAAVHGYALGAGCEWAMNCDIRIAAKGTKFGFPETGLGMTVTNAGTKLLPILVGMGRAKELVFTGDMIDADQAKDWGLVNKVVPLEELDRVALDMARRIARNSSLALTLSKRALNQGICQGFEETLELETRDIALVIQGFETSMRSDARTRKTGKRKHASARKRKE
ncbi:MAG: hypothetical protein DRG37_05420 [Deltaproteobacteria bacterium]|nr:MAG: hypothetical protein DRG37_05420 [Deltaproteobacteria bacterium]